MVIVVGTTPDYIAKIHKRRPEDVAFVVNNIFIAHPLLKAVDNSHLVFTSFEDFSVIQQSVDHYLSANQIRADGIACFDCESLVIASKLAAYLGISFPELEAVKKTRNKFEMRRTLNHAGISTVDAIVASEYGEIFDFFNKRNRNIVLKPLSGSGSELVFHCQDEDEIGRAIQTMKKQLPKRSSNPLFRPIPNGNEAEKSYALLSQWLVEEFISGPEYSCDFILHKGRVKIIRSTGKTPARDQTFGSVLAYIFPAPYPDGFSVDILENVLKDAAMSLGFSIGHFMVDFVIRDGYPFILEMTPRPGGDSIPDLVELATGIDLLDLHLNASSQNYAEPLDIPAASDTFASINIFTKKKGIITGLDVSQILALPSVRSLTLRKNIGDKLSLPPDDYDNRIIGYCIIFLDQHTDITSTYYQINELIQVKTAD
ncbi:putative Argininosuccinate lyase ArgH [uncultured Desulfobacterium sp.]|uniref:Putative Argininosuccinate lyase ArgH n=1 Tax=uncultured Desulfobacterium sp. TaxID=201089 RepID=A0A445MTV7_9BACT|nr:putative Argininosuccinate lyase ArgH [uncultured Desulfobacterium sp.]